METMVTVSLGSQINTFISDISIFLYLPQHAAQNRAKWKDTVVDLCPTGDEQD